MRALARRGVSALENKHIYWYLLSHSEFKFNPMVLFNFMANNHILCANGIDEFVSGIEEGRACVVVYIRLARPQMI